jgi:hypothetical protein
VYFIIETHPVTVDLRHCGFPNSFGRDLRAFCSELDTASVSQPGDGFPAMREREIHLRL